MTDTLTAEIVADDAALLALHDEWQVLWQRIPGAAPFQSPAWLLPWWRQFGTGRPVVAVLRGASLLGVLPLYVLAEAGARKLLPMGIGITDYLDALLAPDAPPDAASVLLRAALDAAGRQGIGTCDLTDLPPNAALRRAVPPPDWRAAWCDGDTCPVLPLEGELRRTVPARQLRKLRMSCHRAARAGGYAVETADPRSLPALLDALVRLHGARWQANGEPGVLADPRVRAFHAEAAPSLLRAGVLRMQALRLTGEIAASCLALVDGGDRILFYIGGFDVARGFESPGTLLIGAMLTQAAAEGRREAHFLRGGEAYKYAWGATDRRNAACHLVRA